MLMRNKVALLLVIVLAVTFLPWLGETHFNTKGEPREAIVALSMVQSGNYILPVSMGTDIAYKPPMLAWLIAACSHLTGGVNETSSRLPSALAAIALSMSVFAFYRRREGDRMAALAAVVTATSFEVFRAASACRVDMVLTAFMVGAMMAIYARYRRKGVGLSWLAVGLMSGAVLTKGPVGMLLPCLVAGVFMLLWRERFWPVAGWLTLSGLLSLVLPALWYVLAARQGGDTFVALVMEENLGRFMGKMSYESHENPFYYNFMTLAAGMLPYTLMALMALFAVKWRGLRRRGEGTTVAGVLDRIAKADPVRVFSTVVIVVIFVFYCIPKSKRSVYLLPIYPFVSYYVALLFRWLVDGGHRRPLAWFAGLVGTLGIVVMAALPVMWMLPPDVVDSLGSHKPGAVNYCAALAATAPSVVGYVLLLLAGAGGALAFAAVRRGDARRVVLTSVGAVVLMYWALSGVYFPAVLNAKSDIDIAEAVERVVPENEMIYSYIPDNLLRYYTVGFYTGDRVRQWEVTRGSATMATDSCGRGAAGYVLVGTKSVDYLTETYGDSYTFTPVYTATHRSCDHKDIPVLMRFERR